MAGKPLEASDERWSDHSRERRPDRRAAPGGTTVPKFLLCRRSKERF